MEAIQLIDLPIAIRDVEDTDYGFILKTWTQEHHKTHPWNFVPNAIYFPNQTNLINSILKDCPVLVACLDDEPNQIVGYLVGKPHDKDNIIVHYACVKGIFRRVGVLRQLLSALDYQNKNINCSHYFELFKKLKDRYSLIFDPTLLDAYEK